MTELDPTVASAIVEATENWLGKALELSVDHHPDSDTEQALSRVYEEKLAGAVTPNSLRVLIVLQRARGFLTSEQVAEEAQQLATQQEPRGKPFEPDITYRLRYLSLLGLVHAGASDFALTRLGVAFIDRARKDDLRYSKAFAGSTA